MLLLIDPEKFGAHLINSVPLEGKRVVDKDISIADLGFFCNFLGEMARNAQA